MSAPDHWVTLCVLGKNSKWSRARVFGVSLATAFGHIGLSVLLGLGVVLVGLEFSSLVSFYLNAGIGLVMVAFGAFVGVRPFVKRSGQVLEGKDGLKESEYMNLSRSVGYFAILGAALSPDISITPVFLAAIPSGLYSALLLSLIFALASLLTLVLLVQIGTAGLAKAFERIPEKYNNSLVGIVIAIIGAYLLISG